MLYGRATEQRVVGQLLTDARKGSSKVLVLRGEAGIGKTAMLDFAAREATGMTVLRGAGSEIEAELPFAALHLILQPVLQRIGELPQRQGAALAGAFGLGPAADADQFLVGMGALSLLAEAAGDRPLLCLVDDAHWLDAASAGALCFAARRLGADPVALVFAARETRPGGEPAFPAPGLPELRLRGLDAHASEDLLAGRSPRLDTHLRERVLADSGGNPLALIELARSLASADADAQPALAAGTPLRLTDRVQEAFARQIEGLPEATGTLLLVAAADGTGDLGTILRAAAALGATAEALAPAERAGLVEATGQSVAFRHPLIRAAAYQAAPYVRRQAAHRALARFLDTGEHADRRAWHLAAAATGPDEEVAAGLEQAAQRARARSGYAAMAAAYQRSAELTPGRAPRARRLAAAAQAAADAGQLDRAVRLADRTEVISTDPVVLAAVAQVRARAEFELGSPRAAHEILVAAAHPVADTDPPRAVAILAEAVRDGFFAGDPVLAEDAAVMLRDVPLPADSPLLPLVRAASALARFTAGDALDGLPPARDLVAAARRAVAAGDPGERLIAAAMTRMAGDDDAALEMSASVVAHVRSRGIIGWLPNALLSLALDQMTTNRFTDVRTAAHEGLRLATDTGQEHWAAYNRLVLAWLAAIQGDVDACHELAQAGMRHAIEHGSHIAARGTHALALLDLGLGRAEAALQRFEGASSVHARSEYVATRYAPDQVEAAIRSRLPDHAAEPLRTFAAWATANGQPWAAAVLERCRALAGPHEQAGEHHTEAIRLHQQSGRPFEGARTQLLYGEWLRRGRRRTDAQAQLGAALDTFQRLGARPWAERARSELRAAGKTTAPPASARDHLSRLTPQELQIVQLAAQGGSNREIAAQLFLSPRTIGYHLYKAYPKLGVTSRAELARLGFAARS